MPRAGAHAGPYYGNLDAIAWYDSNSGSKTHPVGQKQPNGYGLYDMLGNVWEWCSDWYGESYYGTSPAADPKGPSSGQYRVERGGSWIANSRDARVSYRGRMSILSAGLATMASVCAGRSLDPLELSLSGQVTWIQAPENTAFAEMTVPCAGASDWPQDEAPYRDLAGVWGSMLCSVAVRLRLSWKADRGQPHSLGGDEALV